MVVVKGIAYVMVIALVAACGNSVTHSTTHKIGEKTADEYYRQFIYRKDEKADFPYRYLGRSLTKLRKIDQKNHLFYSASLYLLEGGKYVLDYEEWHGEEPQGGLSTLRPVHRSRKRGTWKVTETSLVLETLGTGAGITVNEEEAVVVKFSGPINAHELTGRADVFFPAQSNMAMPD